MKSCTSVQRQCQHTIVGDTSRNWNNFWKKRGFFDVAMGNYSIVIYKRWTGKKTKKIHVSSQKRSSRDSLTFWHIVKRKHYTKGRSPKQLSPWEVLCSFLGFHGVVYSVFVPLENQTIRKQFSSEYEKVFYNSRHECRLYVSVDSSNTNCQVNWRLESFIHLRLRIKADSPTNIK